VVLRRKCNGAEVYYRSYGFEFIQVVGERSYLRRSRTVRSGGVLGSENAGISNDKASENLARRKPKVS
jgi:hypothetical protein